jgi:2-methylisocitrate lyase-like PEP mutase family enzyme
MANQVEDGDTPLLAPAELERLGFKLAAYPLTLLSAATRAMQLALEAFGQGTAPAPRLPFDELRQLLGFPDYDAELSRYRD